MAAGLALARATSNAGGVRAPASGRGKRKDTRADRGVPHEQRDGSVSMTKASYILTKHQREAVVEMLRRGQAIVGELARELKLSREGVQQLADRNGLNGEIAKRRADYVHKLWNTAAKARRKAQREEQLKNARASVNRSEPVTDIVTSLTTVANARTAHGTLGVDQLRSSLREAMPDCDVRMIHVRVWPQVDQTTHRSRAVSMSWWLSAPIQRHLHQQTEGTKNANENGPRLQAVWEVLRSTSSCGSSRRP